ncbi:MAG: 2OG-Fe(II) oxygenase [Cytophagales bacterium]|nr:2OG-Fe(II) oxygenase [Cytophagales bacterium]
MKVSERIVCGRSVFVVDDAVDKDTVDDFHQMISGLPYSRRELDDEDDKYPIFSVNFQSEKFETQTEVGLMGRKLLDELKPHQHKLYRAYINMCHYGDMEYPHLDCDVKADDITVLYYANTDWHYTWGGETHFYEDNEAVTSITPRPGRFVLFDGNIEHVGTIPTRICTQSRFTLAMKYAKA